MARKKSEQPAYQFHVSGQAVVRLDYKDFYLGKHGTPESYARYYSLLAEYNANGKQAPSGESSDPDSTAEHLADSVILVKHITADFRHRKLPSYKSNQANHNRLNNLLWLLDDKHGDEPIDQFGPRKLENLRDGILKIGIGTKKKAPVTRRYCNDLIRNVVGIIRHGVSRELVAPERIVALESLPPLKSGEAKDGTPRKPAPLADIERTIPFLSETVAAMVRLQLGTAMRPSELFRMTPAMIDNSGIVWFYRPDKHKSEHHKKKKAVPILGDALAALSPYLFGDANELCFINEKGTAWNKDTYRRHITRAAEQAGVWWTPYQIRHTTLQVARDNAGPEQAQALAGHSKLSTTEIYAKVNEARAIEAAMVAPQIK